MDWKPITKRLRKMGVWDEADTVRKTEVLKQLAAGAISLSEATERLRLHDAGHTLQLLREAGLTMPLLVSDARTVLSDQALEELRRCLVARDVTTKPERR